MSPLDHDARLCASRPRLSLPLLLALGALGAGVAGFALRGFDPNGLRFGTQLVWHVSALVLFAALAARPAGQMLAPLRGAAGLGRPLLQGLCAVMGVFFFFLLLPGLFAMPDDMEPRGVTAGMTIFIAFTGAVTLVLAASVSRRFCERLGERASRALLGMAVIYFWLCHVLIALTRLSGQGSEGFFYALTLVLLLSAPLARLAGRFLVRSHTPA